MVRGLDLATMVGAEIGPLDKPVVAKSAGQVIYIDHVDTDALRAKYADDPMVDTGKLHVDAIWGAMTLHEAIAQYSRTEEGAFAADGCNYVIASHVIEHVPDMVSWLQEVHAVLKPDGQLRLAVPDRRFTFDYLRQPTGLAAVVNAYARKDRVPNTHSILDFMLNMAPVDCAAAWRGEVEAEKLQRRATFEGAMAVVRDAIQNGTYHDVHCWVFTPASFGQLCVDLVQNGLLEFECAEFFDTAFNEYEFIVSMRKCADSQRSVESWRRMIDSCSDFEAGAMHQPKSRS
jgi:predicted SAM-dependent methyltransferase